MMNDFTKEELEKIYFHMENEPIELANKVKSLIENYCEHEKPKTKLIELTKDAFNALPKDVHGIPTYYTLGQDNIKIWPKPNISEFNLYLGVK